MQNRATAAAFLDAQRTPPPGAWTDNRLAQAQHYTGSIYLALSAVTEAMSSASAWVERRTRRKSALGLSGAGADEEYVPVGDHPLSDILAAPNPHESFASLLGYMTLQWGLCGNAPVWMVPGRGHGRPVELYALPEALLQPVMSPTPEYPEGAWSVTPYYPSGWAWAGGAYGRRFTGMAVIPGQELKKLQAPHPLLRWDGYSPLTACGIQLDIMEAIDRSRHAAFLNGVQLGHIVNIPGASQDQLDQAKASFQARFAGPERARAVIMTATDPANANARVSVDPVGESPREMDYVSSWEQAVKWVLAVFGVPPSITGLSAATGYAEFYAAQVQFHYRLSQFARRMADFFTRHLAGPWSREPGEFRLKIEIPRPRNQDEYKQQMAALAGQGIAAVNEVRAAYDLPPVPHGHLPPALYARKLEAEVFPPEQAAQAEGLAEGADAEGAESQFADPEGPESQATDAPLSDAPPQPFNPFADDSLPPQTKAAHAVGEKFQGKNGRWYVIRQDNGKRRAVPTTGPGESSEQAGKKEEQAKLSANPAPSGSSGADRQGLERSPADAGRNSPGAARTVDRSLFVHADDAERHAAVLRLLPDNWQQVNDVVSVEKTNASGEDISRANDLMADHLRSLQSEHLLLLIEHAAASAKGVAADGQARGASVRGWAAKAAEVLLVEQLLGQQILPGQSQGYDAVLMIGEDEDWDVNVKLVTEAGLQDGFKADRDIPRLQAARRQRGIFGKDMPPFARLTLVFRADHPERCGVYWMPDYGRPVYGAKGSAGKMLRPVLLATLPDLQQAVREGTLEDLQQQCLDTLQKQVDAEQVRQVMIQTETQKYRESAAATAAAVETVRELAGEQASREYAGTTVSSLETTEEGQQAILTSETHKQAMQAQQQAMQAQQQAMQAQQQAMAHVAKLFTSGNIEEGQRLAALIAEGKHEEVLRIVQGT